MSEMSAFFMLVMFLGCYSFLTVDGFDVADITKFLDGEKLDKYKLMEKTPEVFEKEIKPLLKKLGGKDSALADITDKEIENLVSIIRAHQDLKDSHNIVSQFLSGKALLSAYKKFFDDAPVPPELKGFVNAIGVMDIVKYATVSSPEDIMRDLVKKASATGSDSAVLKGIVEAMVPGALEKNGTKAELSKAAVAIKKLVKASIANPENIGEEIKKIAEEAGIQEMSLQAFVMVFDNSTMDKFDENINITQGLKELSVTKEGIRKIKAFAEVMLQKNKIRNKLDEVLTPDLRRKFEKYEKSPEHQKLVTVVSDKATNTTTTPEVIAGAFIKEWIANRPTEPPEGPPEEENDNGTDWKIALVVILGILLCIVLIIIAICTIKQRADRRVPRGANLRQNYLKAATLMREGSPTSKEGGAGNLEMTPIYEDRMVVDEGPAQQGDVSGTPGGAACNIPQAQSTADQEAAELARALAILKTSEPV